MKIGAVSDLHGWLPPFPDEQLDLLLVAGDIGFFDHDGQHLESFKGYSSTVDEFADWLREAGCPVVGIAGNHDFALEQNPALGYDLPWTYLEDEDTIVNGLRIHGSPWCNRFGRWAFMLDEDDLTRKYARIPDDTEILLTHGPPHGMGDLAPEKYGLPPTKHVGSTSLAARLTALDDLKLHVFGHIHGGRGDYGTSHNVALVGENYEPVRAGVAVFEL